MNIENVAKKARELFFWTLPIVILMTILYPMFHFKMKQSREETVPVKKARAVYPHQPGGESQPAIQVIRPGEVQDIPIRARRIRFLSDLNGLRFKLYDASNNPIRVPDSTGKLVYESDLLMNWSEYKAERLVFYTTTDAKEWLLEWWHPPSS